jgi:glycosyltransferase involved in cell wall biosynthesis
LPEFVADRLLLVMAVPARGGAEEYALTIGRAAVSRGWSVSATLPFAAATETLRGDLHAAGIATAPLRSIDRMARDDPEPPARAKIGAAAGFARAARRFRPHVVHVTLTWPTFGYPFLIASALLGLPTLVAFQLVPSGLFVPRRRRLVHQLMHDHGQRWIAVSDHGRRHVAALYRIDPAAIGVIHNGAPSAQRASANGDRHDDRAATRAELGLSPESTVLLSLGRLHPQKGQAELVRAAATIHAQRPDVRVLIAGDGPERGRLEALVTALGLEDVVALLGHRRDPSRLMDAADLFVFPSHLEGTPFAMLEAMAHGLPVVATAFEGVEEVVEDGQTGLLTQVGRPDELGAAIIAALADPHALERLGAAGRRRAADFSQESMIAATMHELEGLRASRG